MKKNEKKINIDAYYIKDRETVLKNIDKLQAYIAKIKSKKKETASDRKRMKDYIEVIIKDFKGVVSLSEKSKRELEDFKTLLKIFLKEINHLERTETSKKASANKEKAAVKKKKAPAKKKKSVVKKKSK